MIGAGCQTYRPLGPSWQAARWMLQDPKKGPSAVLTPQSSSHANQFVLHPCFDMNIGAPVACQLSQQVFAAKPCSRQGAACQSNFMHQPEHCKAVTARTPQTTLFHNWAWGMWTEQAENPQIRSEHLQCDTPAFHRVVCPNWLRPQHHTASAEPTSLSTHPVSERNQGKLAVDTDPCRRIPID